MLPALLLDIRTKEEYCKGHIPGAILIETPLPPLTSQKKTTLKRKLSRFVEVYRISKNRPIIVYCKKGIRAGEAKKILLSLGYTNIMSLGGVETEPLKSKGVFIGC